MKSGYISFEEKLTTALRSKLLISLFICRQKLLYDKKKKTITTLFMLNVKYTCEEFISWQKLPFDETAMFMLNVKYTFAQVKILENQANMKQDTFGLR